MWGGGERSNEVDLVAWNVSTKRASMDSEASSAVDVVTGIADCVAVVVQHSPVLASWLSMLVVQTNPESPTSDSVNNRRYRVRVACDRCHCQIPLVFPTPTSDGYRLHYRRMVSRGLKRIFMESGKGNL